jgi:hypothetical protein
MRLTRSVAATIAVGALLFAGSAKAIVVGQTDNFEDDTLQNWANGGVPGVPPVLNINTGGPAGAGDNFMQVTSDGVGVGRYLTVFNRSQWLGDYIGTGVIAIEMDLRNLGSVDLNIRLAFKQFVGSGGPGYLSAPISLLAGGGWQHVVFSITPGTMIAVAGPSDFTTFFSNGFGELRIINEAGTDNLNGDAVAGQIGVDNIHAVPEPGAVALLAIAGLLALTVARRKRE